MTRASTNSLTRIVCALAAVLVVVLCTTPAPGVRFRGGDANDVFCEPLVDEAAEPQDEGEEEELPDRVFGPLGHPDCGLTVEPVYTGEVFSNARGGISTRRATRYLGMFDIGLSADSQQLGLPLPGNFFMLAQDFHGQGLTSDFVGDAQVISNIDAFRSNMQVSEYWWELPVWDGRVTVRLGKQDLNTEFLVVDMAGDFIQSSFGISPHLAVTTFPDASAAAVVLAQLTDAVQLKVGVWDGLPDGRNWGFSGTGITFTVGELEYKYALCDGQLPGAVDVGIGYTSAGEVDGIYMPQTWGWYLDFEQIICREACGTPDDEQGLGVFAQYGSGYPKATVEFQEYFGAGLVYRGLIAGRDDDTCGVGVARSRLSLGGTGVETATEVFYKARLRPGVYVQPDLQYIASPSGLYRDALVVGLRFEVAF